jgi:hypothetical protein
MNSLIHYIVYWKLHGHKYYLLWCGSNDGQDDDYFVTIKFNGVARLFITRDLQKLLNYADTNNIKLNSRSEVDFQLDIDRLRNILPKLKAGKPISEKKAVLLLHSWNVFIDVNCSIGKPILEIKVRTRKYTNKEKYKIYNKIFWGNNLPSLTPEGKKYYPIFSKKEIYFIKHMLGFALKEIVNEIAFSVQQEKLNADKDDSKKISP